MKRIALFFLIAIGVAVVSCKKVFFEEEPANNPVALFDHLWLDYKQSYGPTADRHVNWDSLYSVYRPMVSDQSSEDSLHAVITSMLALLNDGHVMLISPGRKQFSSNRIYRESIDDKLFNAKVIEKNYLDKDITAAPDTGFLYGIIDHNGGEIVYVRLAYIADNLPILEQLMDKYPDAKGMIIDLRHNGGGDFTWAFTSMERFTNEKRLVFSSATKNGTGPDDYTPWYEWHLNSSGNFYDKKLAVLTDRYTISAGERTVMAFSVLPNATTIGDSTNGAHATMIGRELANGWYYTMPIQKTRFVDGKSYEGIGMPPDIYVKNTLPELEAGKDAVMDKALSLF